MTGKERIITALELGQPDTVPIWELAFNEKSIIKIARHFMDEKQLPEPKFYGDMNETEFFKLANAFITIIRELNLDGLNTVTNAPFVRIDSEHIKDADGVIFHLSEVGEPYCVEGIIKEPSDLKNFKLRRPQPMDFLQIKILRSIFPDKAISFMLKGPFHRSWGLLGSMDKLLMEYILNPKFAQELSRITTDYCLEAVEIIAEKGADFIVMECDLAFNSGTLMSPAHYDEFIGKYHREIIDLAHKKNLKIVKHTDGNVMSILPHFIKEGFDGFHPVQPQCMEISEVKKKYGDKICIMGNIDCSFLLVDGTPYEVDESVKNTIAVAAPGGGYIISSSNTIHPGCKAENYIVMVKAARKYGGYSK